MKQGDCDCIEPLYTEGGAGRMFRVGPAAYGRPRLRGVHRQGPEGGEGPMRHVRVELESQGTSTTL